DITTRSSATLSPTLRKRRRETETSITSAGLSPSWPVSEEAGTKPTPGPLAGGGLTPTSIFHPKHEIPGHRRSRGSVQYTEGGYRVPLALGVLPTPLGREFHVNITPVKVLEASVDLKPFTFDLGLNV
ncbi:unnamed protein product, partial [Dibothriocephalus latus]